MKNMIQKMKHGIELKALEKHEFRKGFKKECTDFTPLMLAIGGEFPHCLDCAKILIDNGADPKQVDFEGNTLLHIAAKREIDNTFEYVLEHNLVNVH